MTCNGSIVDTTPNGNISCTDGYNYGSKCTFICDDKYDLTSEYHVITCITNGGISEWDASAPACQGKKDSCITLKMCDS